MSLNLYGWILSYLQSDGKCEGCTFESCARFAEALFCPYTGTEMRAVKKMRWSWTDAPTMTREEE